MGKASFRSQINHSKIDKHRNRGTNQHEMSWLAAPFRKFRWCSFLSCFSHTGTSWKTKELRFFFQYSSVSLTQFMISTDAKFHKVRWCKFLLSTACLHDHKIYNCRCFKKLSNVKADSQTQWRRLLNSNLELCASADADQEILYVKVIHAMS